MHAFEDGGGASFEVWARIQSADFKGLGVSSSPESEKSQVISHDPIKNDHPIGALIFS